MKIFRTHNLLPGLRGVRRLLLGLGWLIATVSGAEEPAVPAPAPPTVTLLRETLEHYRGEGGHWAYTETTIIRVKHSRRPARVTRHTVARRDPSLPYDQQWTLLEKDGRKATARDVERYRRERQRQAGKNKGFTERFDLDRAVLHEETPETVTFEIPMRPDPSSPIPPEKFTVWLTVNRRDRVFEHAEVRQRRSFHMKLVARMDDTKMDVEFTRVDPKFPPPITVMKGNMALSFLFMNFTGDAETTRTDFKRVTPYDDHFQVKLGPLKVLDF